jgi:cysteinyl-tRNA synthetase|tara:strand:+ start:619 stop:960 length:342 start_codon:yes stop_codon:yes gene_type:complete
MDLEKNKLIIIIPIVVSILAATFGSIRYIINLTDTIEKNNQQVMMLNKDIQIIFDKYAQDKEEFTREMFNVNGRVTEVNAYFRAMEEILRKTTDSVRDQQWDIKDLQREVLGD